MSAHADVVVVGAGAVGLASAWRLAQRGMSVTVVDPAPGSGASGVAAGMLAPVTEARLGEQALLELGMASWELWPSFAAELGAGIGYRADGTVVVALDADDRAALRDLVDRQRDMGLEIANLSAADLRMLEPALAPGVRIGARADGERSVDPAALVGELLRATEEAGVTVLRQQVAGIELAAQRVVGVSLTEGGGLSAGTVVVAAGSWSGQLTGLPDELILPVRPVKGQVLTLRQRPGDVIVRHTVRGLVRGASIYLVPRDDGRLVCGATVEERGWDTVVTAGAAYELLRDALSLFPGLDEAEIVGLRSGFRPGTPDDMPLIGASGIDGLVLACGHYRNGILLTPITAEAVVSAVVGEPRRDELAACDPRRFSRSLGGVT